MEHVEGQDPGPLEEGIEDMATEPVLEGHGEASPSRTLRSDHTLFPHSTLTSCWTGKDGCSSP